MSEVRVEAARLLRWWCHCGHSWNTFDTAGLCPSCGFQWEITACLSCLQWSKHLDWYAPRGEGRPGGDAT